MCYTVTKKPLREMPAYIKIPVIVVYVPIVLFGIGYFNAAFNLLTFPRFHEVRNFFLRNAVQNTMAFHLPMFCWVKR